MTLAALALRWHLRGDHTVRVFIRESAQRAQPRPPHRHRRVDQHDGVELRRIEHFKEQRNVVHEDRIASLARDALQLEAPLLHGGMDEGIQRRECGIVTNDLGAQGDAIERAVRRQHIGPEPLRNRGEHRTARRLRLAGERIGVDDRRAPLLEEIDDG